MRIFWSARFLAIAGFALVALLVAACGGGGDDDDDDGNNQTSATATQSQPSDGGDGATETPTEDAGGGGDDGGGDALDVCGLLTTDEVSDAFGQTAKEGFVSSDSATKPECEWDTEAGFPDIVVLLSVYSPGNRAAAQDDFEVFEDNSDAVDGLGERAHWVEFLSVLEVLQGEHNLAIQVISLVGGVDDKELALEMAAHAVPRLP